MVNALFTPNKCVPTLRSDMKASVAIAYEELNRIWDRILPNAYAEIIKTPEQPAFASRREIT